VEPETVVYPAAKRALDRVVALAFLMLMAPFFGLAFGAMTLDALRRPRDRGPYLYREPRISAGRTFDLLKFRTLRRDVLARAEGEAHARLLEADPDNLTWAGRRVLKPWYLDELPQLWNVLRGDLSLVGPRPWPPSMVERQVAAGLDYRLRVPAGWTGPAQVEKGVTEPAGYTSLDLAYVDACRTSSGARLLLRDLRILGRTVKVLARGEGLQY
jgi:lipopolysaccharide/colanic/teichoic acid biosynthesis glycosyltransferase